MQIGALALKERMRGEREKNVEVAGRATAHAGLAFAREADAGAVLDAGRNIDRQRRSRVTRPSPSRTGTGRRSPGRGRRNSGRSARA